MNTPIRLTTRWSVFLVCLLFFNNMQAQNFLAKDVFSHTLSNQTVTLDVIGSANNFKLDKVVLTNHGTAEIVNNKIVFTPAPDFAGVAFVNYTVCDLSGVNCVCNLATIDVAELVQPAAQAMNLFVKHNGTAIFTLPKGYKLNADQSTLNGGTITETSEGSGVWTFSPSENPSSYTSYAYFYNFNDNRYTQFEVYLNVLKAPDVQLYTKNDYGVTFVNKPITLNVLNNDKQDNIKSVIVLSSEDGDVVDNGSGSVTFTPKLHFKGVANFYYQVTTNDNKTEIGKVSVVVSNFAPDVLNDVEIQASPGSPVLLQYRVPVSNFKFNTLSNNTTNGGQIKFYDNFEGTINGKVVKANNVLVYTPPTSTSVQVDEFLVGYYLPETNEEFPWQRVIVKINGNNNPCTSIDCLWPGDANHDGVVDVSDLSTISKNLGTYGKSRLGSIDWVGQNADDWDSYDNGVNLKYADSNGDGIISEQDVDAIVQNFNLKSSIVPTPILPKTDASIYVPQMSTQFGNLLEIPVTVASSESPVFDALGLSFDILYDADFFKDGSVQLDFDKAGWLSRFDSYLSINKQTSRGEAIAALARTKEKGATGHGEIGKIKAVVIDDVAGFKLNDKTTINIKLHNIKMLGKDGQLYSLPDKEIAIPIVKKDKNEPLKDKDLVMYPNPASDVVNFYINGANVINYVRIMDVTGREVSRVNNVNGQQVSLPTGQLSHGLYITEIMTEKGRIIKKLEIMK